MTTAQVQRIVITPLEQASVFLPAGPRMLDVTTDGRIRRPKLVSMTVPAYGGASTNHRRTRALRSVGAAVGGAERCQQVRVDRPASRRCDGRTVRPIAALTRRLATPTEQPFTETFDHDGLVGDARGHTAVEVSPLVSCT